MSETAKYKHLTTPYCYRPDGTPGVGLDIASQGDPVVPWAWQLDLPDAEFERYSGGRKPLGIQLAGRGQDPLRVRGGSLDFIYSSHFIEDLPRAQWPIVFREWARCLKPGGKLVVLVPERERWQAALQRGQIPNCSHYGPEPLVGDMTQAVAAAGGLRVLKEELTNLDKRDYSILMVAEKI